MTNNIDRELSDIRGALGSIGLSSIIIFAGSILNQLSGFGTRVILTQFLPVDGYGDIVIGITILNFLGIVSILGLNQAFPRYLPRVETKEQKRSISSSIFQIGIFLSLFWAIILFIIAEDLSYLLFNRRDISAIIRVFSLSLPFYVFSKLCLSGIQGYKKTTQNVLTTNVIQPLSRVVAIAIVAFAGLGTTGLSAAYNIAFVFASISGYWFFLRISDYNPRSLLSYHSLEEYKKLLTFSAPLAVSSGFALITKNSDRFLLGVLDTSSAVGIYDVAYLLAQLTLFFGPVLNYLFQPIISKYDSDGNYEKIDKIYTIITRWLVILTLPIFSVFIIHPETMLGFFFGDKYRTGAATLLILSSGFFYTRVVGPSGSLLSAMGKTKLLMISSVLTATLNVILNIILIPRFGIAGAAIATACGGILNASIHSIVIYLETGIHPYETELITPLAISFIFVLFLRYWLNSPESNVFIVVATAVAVFVSSLLSFTFTKSIYVVELQLVESLLSRIGVDINLRQHVSYFTIDGYD